MPFPLGNLPAVLLKLFSALSVQLYETSTLSNYNLSREIFLCYYGSCCLLFFHAQEISKPDNAEIH